tara:strand:- start:2942 stop:3349 length:408 start_codon:yes stop_codon:yes gene_type:complete
MGTKLAIILGGLLVSSIAASAWYIDRLLDEISILKGNQIVLETQIQEQNKSIKNYLEKTEKVQQQIQIIEKQKQEAEREVNQLRNTFAKHDLDKLALAKPGLIQKRVNDGTRRVKEELIALTNPEQFDDEEINIE